MKKDPSSQRCRRFRTGFVGIAAALLLPWLLQTGCGGARRDDGKRTIYLNSGGRVRTFDPALAADSASRNMVAAVFDTLLEYDYLARPYKLVPAMLERMPECVDGGRTYVCTLRDDLYFHPDAAWGADREARRVRAADAVFGLLRLADARLHSPMYWVVRGRIEGIEKFYETTSRQSPGDWCAYEQGVPGLRVLDERRFVIRLTKPDPRFAYHLALPCTAPVPRDIARRNGNDFGSRPVGSGPFAMREWRRDYRIVFERFGEFRKSYFAGAARAEDRTTPLPLADRVVCYLVRQNLSSHLMFLQGQLDLNVLDRDNTDLAAGGELAPALRARGVRLIRQMEPEIRYIGCNMSDARLGGNEHLRRAIALAFDVSKRVAFASGQLIPAEGPVPPGIAGYDASFRNPLCRRDLEAARRELALAGYPGGVDERTGERLRLTFDQNGAASANRQQGEMLVSDLRELGISVEVLLSSSPRFFQKLRQGQTQLFRLSWVGDYPDAENFLQVFYGPNAGGCNRTNYRDGAFDAMFRELATLPDGAGRENLVRRMVRRVTSAGPWIFEGYPVSFQLLHGWLENYHANDFVFNRWKYLAVDTAARERISRTFKPLDFRELQGR